MFPYIPNTEEDRKSMLDAMNCSSIEDLFSDIPDELKLKGRLNLKDSMSELEVKKQVKGVIKENESVEDMICFLGAGAYDHFIPSAVNAIVSRSEFYTAYTPYQPEISQGTLQGIFEYQTMIANLTGMEVSNASMYDGATACAEAAMMALASTKRKQVLVSKTVNPETRKVLATYMRFHGGEVVEVDYKDGVTDTEKLQDLVSKDTAAVIVQNPNFFGIVEDAEQVEKIAHGNKALLIMNVDPISLAALKTPGEIGADIAVGEGQSLGNELNFGGPYLGFMATNTKLMRKMPGRITGETTDVDGKRAFVLTLQAREQHIRRQKATSNICSNEALCALTAAVYMSLMGKKGMEEVADQCIRKANYALKGITKSGKFKKVFDKPVFNEFVVESKVPAEEVNKKLLKEGILGGYDLGKTYPEMKNCILFCVTEKRTKGEIDKLVRALEVIA